jgi:energy-coupling factor transporter ATP-binding protein EcfA2
MSEPVPSSSAPAPSVPGPGPDGAVRGADTVDLDRRVGALERAIELSGPRLDASAAAAVRARLAVVRERLALGVDQTVVALAGGTGSGKSSLFNAIAGLEFAEVGVKRPTTARVTACVWGTDGGPLLDWVGVGPDERIERESALDGDREVPLRGLVLLDLPDHDSVSAHHREVVDRVLPLSDLLVWVVDPQKYADDALHSGYLRHLVGHESSMLVVLNQADTLAPEVLPDLVSDLGGLLAADGLTGVPVLTTSARTGAGVGELRDALADLVRGRSLAARRAGADVVDAADALSDALGTGEPSPGRLAVSPVVDSLAAAVGLPAVADAIGAVVRSGAREVPELGPAPRDAVELARSQWLESATTGLPRLWSDWIAGRVATSDELRLALTDDLAAIRLAAHPSRPAAVLQVVAGVLAVAALAFGGIGLGLGLGSEPAPPWALLVAVGCAVGALVAYLVARPVRQAAARRRSSAALADGRAAIDAMARERLVAPTQQVLDELRAVRETVAGARAGVA